MLVREGLAPEEVFEAENGDAALEVFYRERPWFVITDIRMALRSGLDFIDSLGPKLVRESYIVILSGYDAFSYAQRAMRGGAREYLLKPISRADLALALRRATESYGAFRAAEVDQRASVALVRESALRYALLNEALGEGDYASLALQADLGPLLSGYVVFAGRSKAPWADDGFCLPDPERPYLSLSIVPERACLGARMPVGFGHSSVSRGLASLRLARAQAVRAWQCVYLDGSIESAGPDYAERLSDEDVVERISDWLRHPELFAGKAEYVSRLGKSLAPERLRRLRPERVADAFAAVSRELELQPGSLRGLDDPFSFASFGEALGQCARVIEGFADLRWGDGADPSGEGNVRSRQIIERALHYIRDNFSNPELNMAMVSNSLSLTYSYFSELFKAVTGKNFVAYLRQLRVAQARILLRETALLVEEVAAKVGFSDAKRFSKIFRADVGCSPSEYRQAAKDDE